MFMAASGGGERGAGQCSRDGAQGAGWAVVETLSEIMQRFVGTACPRSDADLHICALPGQGFDEIMRFIEEVSHEIVCPAQILHWRWIHGHEFEAVRGHEIAAGAANVGGKPIRCFGANCHIRVVLQTKGGPVRGPIGPGQIACLCLMLIPIHRLILSFGGIPLCR